MISVIHPEALRQWVRQAETDRGEHADRATTSETDELVRLRREVAELRTDLSLDALKLALWQRKIRHGGDLMYHSDSGWPRSV